MEGISITIAIVFLVFIGGLWWENGGELVARRMLMQRGVNWLFPAGPFLLIILLVIGYLLESTITPRYFFWSAAGTLACISFLKGVVHFTVSAPVDDRTTTATSPSTDARVEHARSTPALPHAPEIAREVGGGTTHEDRNSSHNDEKEREVGGN